jgi:hypothetical protein
MRPLLLALALCLPVIQVVHAEDFTIENDSLGRTWRVADGRLSTIAIVNKLAGKTSVLGAGDEFRLRISDDVDREDADRRTLTAADFTVTGTERTSVDGVESLIFHLANQELQADLRITLAKEASWLRKRLTLTARRPLVLERIDTEALALAGARQPYTLRKITADGPAQWKPGLGQPLYGDQDATFWGIEFPAADNSVAGDKLVCGHLHGRPLTPDHPYDGYPSVMGVGDDARFITDVFFDYIDRTRARPFRIQVQYNTWFDFRGGNRELFAASVGRIHDELVVKRGVAPLDAYVIDDGWQDKKVPWTETVWPVNPAVYDPDFRGQFATVSAARSHLGLWISPGMVFGAASKVPALKQEGYETLGRWASLAGPRYMDALEERMAALTTAGVAFYKLDGLFGHLNQREFELHGRRYGLPELPYLGAGDFAPDDKRLNDPRYDELKLYYLVAGTERLVRNFDRLGRIDPKVYIVISNAAYLSPWWLQHCDTAWMINAGDEAKGASRTEGLVYRDRILYQLSVSENTQFPLNAIFNHEPKKTATEDAETFRRYLFMAFSRGTGFLELYLKPSALQDSDWAVLADGITWARATGGDFKRTRMHGGDPGERQAYGFTGWSRDSGYISWHNPGTEPATSSVTLDRAFGLLPASGRFRVTSPFADGTRGLRESYAYGDTLAITLAPGEVRILNFVR